MLRPVEVVPFLVAHELIHVQQTYLSRTPTLLAQACYERETDKRKMVWTYANEFTTASAPGKCTIRVSPPSGYVVPSTQPNPVTVDVVIGVTVDVTFRLARSAA